MLTTKKPLIHYRSRAFKNGTTKEKPAPTEWNGLGKCLNSLPSASEY
jgi:hypothetical protein